MGAVCLNENPSWGKIYTAMAPKSRCTRGYSQNQEAKQQIL